MQIKVEIDVKPEELRRFLGLPDVAGLQDDVVRFLREKVSSASENFDPTAVVQGSLDLIKRTPAWRKLRGAWAAREQTEATDLESAKAATEATEVTIQVDPPRPKAARKPATRKAAAGKTAAKRPARRRKPAR